MDWKNKRVLVTGAGGFIGSHLVEALHDLGAQVRAFVRYNSRNNWGAMEFLPISIREDVEVFCGDIQDHTSVAKAVAGCDVVFHLAALVSIPYSYISPEGFVNTNINGTLNVMQACLAEGVSKVIHTSTSETYGTARYTPIDEDHPQRAQSPYAASKIGADKIAESFYLSFNLPVATVRPFNTYGPRQSARAVIPTIISQALVKEEIRLGSLTPVRDFCYVEDTVKGFIMTAESQNTTGEVINIGSAQGITIGELAEKIIQLVGGKKKLAYDAPRVRPEESEVMVLVCCNSKANKLLGWKPTYSLEEGLRNTIEWISENIHLFKSNIYQV